MTREEDEQLGEGCKMWLQNGRQLSLREHRFGCFKADEMLIE